MIFGPKPTTIWHVDACRCCMKLKELIVPPGLLTHLELRKSMDTLGRNKTLQGFAILIWEIIPGFRRKSSLPTLFFPESRRLFEAILTQWQLLLDWDCLIAVSHSIGGLILDHVISSGPWQSLNRHWNITQKIHKLWINSDQCNKHQVIHCYGMGIATRVLRKADAMQFESYIENLAACQTVETLKMKEAVVRESVLPSSWHLWGRAKKEGIKNWYESIDSIALSDVVHMFYHDHHGFISNGHVCILRTSQESLNQSNRLCIHAVSFTAPKLADVKLYFQSGGHIIWPWSTTAYLDLNAGWWAVTISILLHYKTCQKNNLRFNSSNISHTRSLST